MKNNRILTIITILIFTFYQKGLSQIVTITTSDFEFERCLESLSAAQGQGNIADNNEVILNDISSVNDINCTASNGYGGIVSIQGIEEFFNLTDLQLQENSGLIDLTPIFGLQNLVVIRLFRCSITGILDFSQMENLQIVGLDFNNVSGIIFSNTNTSLQTLDIKNNQLSVLTLPDSPPLEQLILANNQLTGTLDLSSFYTTLTDFWVCGNPDLNCLQINESDLPSLQGNLSAFTCANPPSLNTDVNGILYDQSTTFVSSDCSADYVLVPDDAFEQALIDNGIDSEGVLSGILDNRILREDAEAATVLNLAGDSQGAIPSYENVFFTADNNQAIGIDNLTGLDAFTNIEVLYIQGNGETGPVNTFTSLDLSSNLALRQLFAFRNPNLQNINLNGLTNLINIGLNECAIQTIDLSTNTNLLDVNLRNQKGFGATGLEAITFGTISTITDLQLLGNNLNEVDISNFDTNMIADPYFDGSADSSFTISDNPSLTCILVNNSDYATQQVTTEPTSPVSGDTNWIIPNGNGSPDVTIFKEGSCTVCTTVSVSLSFEAFLEAETANVQDAFGNAVTGISDGIPGNGLICQSAAEMVTSITMLGSGFTVTDFAGIEHFSSLNFFNLTENTLAQTTLDLSSNFNLLRLDAANTQLTNLVLPPNGSLVYINVARNPNLTTLNLSGVLFLEEFYAFEGGLRGVLNLGSNTQLRILGVENCNISDLILPVTSTVETLMLRGNLISELDLRLIDSRNVDVLFTCGNPLSCIQVNDETEARSKVVTTLVNGSVCPPRDDVIYPSSTQNPEWRIDESTNLTTADSCLNCTEATFATDLQSFLIDDANNFRFIDSNGDEVDLDPDGLGYVCAEQARLVTSLNLAGDSQGQFESYDGVFFSVTANEAQGFSDMSGLDAFTNIEVLYIQGNGSTGTQNTFANLDLSGNINLQQLFAFANPNLQSIDLNGLINLKNIGLNGCSLTTLDLSVNVGANAPFLDVNVGQNQLTSINFGEITNITDLQLLDNNLTEVDICNFDTLLVDNGDPANQALGDPSFTITNNPLIQIAVSDLINAETQTQIETPGGRGNNWQIPNGDGNPDLNLFVLGDCVDCTRVRFADANLETFLIDDANNNRILDSQNKPIDLDPTGLGFVCLQEAAKVRSLDVSGLDIRSLMGDNLDLNAPFSGPDASNPNDRTNGLIAFSNLTELNISDNLFDDGLQVPNQSLERLIADNCIQNSTGATWTASLGDESYYLTNLSYFQFQNNFTKVAAIDVNFNGIDNVIEAYLSGTNLSSLEITSSIWNQLEILVFENTDSLSAITGLPNARLLQELRVSGSGITGDLDLTGNSNLRVVELNDNNLFTIDLSSNTAVQTLTADDNLNLTQVILPTAGGNMANLSLSNNSIQEIDISGVDSQNSFLLNLEGNLSLTCIKVSNNQDAITRLNTGAYLVPNSNETLFTEFDCNTPTITITSTQENAEENGPINGSFTVQVSSVVEGCCPLAISYSIGGTAVPNEDYSTLSGVVEIPVGSSSSTIEVEVIDNDDADDTETVIVTLENGDAYLLGNQTEATVIIQNDVDTQIDNFLPDVDENTFNIIVRQNSCPNSSNGEILLEINETTEVFQLNFNGEDLGVVMQGEFLIFDELSAGLYQLELAIPEKQWQKVFNLAVNLTDELSLQGYNIDYTQKSAFFKVKGSSSYEVVANGKILSFNGFSANEIALLELPLIKGINNVEIKGLQECQGILYEQISFDKLIHYPVPAKNILFVSGLTTEKPNTIKIFDVSGRLILLKNQNILSSQFEINVSQIPEGRYWLWCSDGINSQQVQFLKQ